MIICTVGTDLNAIKRQQEQDELNEQNCDVCRVDVVDCVVM